MRSVTAIASCALLALPLVSLSSPARADNNDFLNQAKKFFNDDNDRDAYERGREDELRRQQAERDRECYQRDATARLATANLTATSVTAILNYRYDYR